MKLYIEVNAGNCMFAKRGVVYRQIVKVIEGDSVQELRDSALELLKSITVFKFYIIHKDEPEEPTKQLNMAINFLEQAHTKCNLSFFVGGNSYVKAQLKE